MTTIVQMPYREANQLRHKLIDAGADPVRVSVTPTNGLQELDAQIRRESMRLVPDADAPDDHPRLGLTLTTVVIEANADMWADAQTPDERESTRYAIERMRGNTPELRNTNLGGDAA